MAMHGKSVIVKLVSEAGTGYYIVTFVNPKNMEGKKLRLKKYDPRIRKHVWFKQEKIK